MLEACLHVKYLSFFFHEEIKKLQTKERVNQTELFQISLLGRNRYESEI